MDPITHGLASYSLTRAIFPRATRVTLFAGVLAGMAPDLDDLSRYGSASAFFIWHRTGAHSVPAVLAMAILFSSVVMFVSRKNPARDSGAMVVLILAAVGFLHVGFDLTQNEGIRLLSPFRSNAYSADWVAHFDLWIMLALLAGVLLPQLLGLVTEEIGAKSKAPRGRIGAALALAAVGLYIGGRAILHANAVGTMNARTYRGEVPWRVAAFAESDSPLRWRGMVDTERAIHEFPLDLAVAASFNPDAGVVSYKPEPSPALEAASNSDSVRRFLAGARFPRASVEKTATGFRVQIRDLAPPREEGQSGNRVIAVVELDANTRVVSDELVWSKF